MTSLTADPEIVGPFGSSTIRCVAMDPDGDNLSYSWNGGGGTISGSGATVTWTAPLQVGSYEISVVVDDGRGASASDTTGVEVRDGSLLVRTRNVLLAVDMSGEHFGLYDALVESEVLGTRIFTGPIDVRELDHSGNVIGQIPRPPRVTRVTSFSMLPGERVAFLENATDSVFVVGSDGTVIDAVEMPDASNINQSLSGVVVENNLIISGTDTRKLVKLDLSTYEATVFRELDELPGRLGDIDYRNGVYYLTQSEKVYMFTEQEDPTEFFHLVGGDITSVAVVGNYAYATASTEGRIYRIDVSTGEAEIFVEGLNDPRDIEFVPVTLVAP
jgi:hypothetical protein